MKKLILFLAFWLLSSTALPQVIPTTPGEGKSPAKKTNAQFISEALRDGRVDPKFSGQEIAPFIKSMEKALFLSKREFESTAEFDARRSASLKKFMGSRDLEGTFYFSLPVTKIDSYDDSSNGLWYRYNADAETVELFALPIKPDSPLNGNGAPDQETNSSVYGDVDVFRSKREVISKSAYRATNGYGAGITVEKYVRADFGIAANRIPFINLDRNWYYSSPVSFATLSMERLKAKKELAAIKAIVVMRLREPYIIYNYVHIEPIRKYPTEVSSSDRYLAGDVLGIIFYSGLTGQIIAKLPANF